MNTIFADTFYFLALLNPNDQAHQQAEEFSLEYTGKLVTTEFVMLELGDALSQPEDRPVFLEAYDEIKRNPMMECVNLSAKWMKRGLASFRRYHDKAWTLTDCISMEVMRERSIQSILTADHHFTQAGFVTMFKK
jgi:predicted nucleic acid-binding protein